MKITDLQIDGFGVWSGLSLNGLSPDLTVFYGPNEAGKSTLLQFVRSVCFGYSPERRRFLPPVHGGRPGGMLSISAAHGRFQVARHDDGHVLNGAARSLGTLQVTSPEGTIQSEAIWRALLAGVDEPTFNNVFAVGLRDVQELNTLSDTDAAQYLYDISAGRDRVSLAEVLRELEASRGRLIGTVHSASGHMEQENGTPEKPALIADLTLHRDRLQAEIDDLRQHTPRLGRLAAQGNTLKQECEQLEAEIGRLQQQIRIYDLAGSLRPKWLERQAIDHQLEALGPVESLPLDLLAKLDRLNLRGKKVRRRHARLVGELRIAKGEAAALKIDEPLLKQAPRIEVLSEQMPFIQALEKQIATLEDELADLEHRHHSRKQQLGISPNAPSATAALISAASTLAGSSGAMSGSSAAGLHAPGGPGVHRGWSYFRPTASRLRDARRKHQEAQTELSQHKQTASEIKTQVSSKLGTRSPTDVTADMERTGKVVTQLRRRIQLEDRLKQLGLQKTELDEHVEAAFQEILLPPHVLFGLGGLFAFGLLLIVMGLFFPLTIIGRVGWALGFLGAVGMGAAGGLKWFWEHRAEHHADHCSSQLDTLNQQIKDAEQERDDLDAQLPKGGGALTARLQTAEAQLTSLQELLPLHSHKETTEQTARSVEDRARQADDNYQKAKQNWRKLLRTAGLEENLSPSDVAQRTREEEHKAHSHRQVQLHAEREQQKAALEHAAKREELSNVEQIVFVKREEISNRRREHEAITARIKQLLTDAGLLASGRNPFEQLVQLRRDVDDQKALTVRRRNLHRRRKTHRSEVGKFAKLLVKLRRRRAKLLHTAGVANYAEVRRRTAEFAKFELLRKQREALTHDITTALVNAFPEKAPGTLGSGGNVARSQEVKVPETFSFSEALLHEHLDANPQTFDARRTDAEQRLQTNQQRYADLLQQRGELSAQSKTLLEDRRLQHKQLELNCLERKLADAVERWQVLATTTGLLDSTRREFETERQPETLREASQYFARLTEGRYSRVWTPLGEPILKVDDAEGHTIPVEKLSCGTREQLFLSLRLALAALYARRGADLPLVLDDVLVNYDTNRARAAAQVLRDFAAQGHQLLVFTCHEHILDLFSDIGVDARYLPVNGDAARTVEAAPAPLPAKRKPRRERTVKREPQPPLEIEANSDELKLAPLPPDEEKPRAPSFVFVPPSPPPQPSVRVERLQPAIVPAPVTVAPPLPRAKLLREFRAVAEHRRVDPPQERSVLYFQRGKWRAEEHDGELADRVAVRVRPEDLPLRTAAPSTPVVAVRAGDAPEIVPGYVPEIVVEHKRVVGPGRASYPHYSRVTPLPVTPLDDDDFLGTA